MLIEAAQNETSQTLDETCYTSTTEYIQPARREDLIEPRVAAVELIEDFKRLAKALSPRDLSTQDDLVQEMCLAALDCTAPNKRSYYTWLAGWRAKDYLRWWLTPMVQGEPEPESDSEFDEEPSAA